MHDTTARRYLYVFTGLSAPIYSNSRASLRPSPEFNPTPWIADERTVISLQRLASSAPRVSPIEFTHANVARHGKSEEIAERGRLNLEQRCDGLPRPTRNHRRESFLNSRDSVARVASESRVETRSERRVRLVLLRDKRLAWVQGAPRSGRKARRKFGGLGVQGATRGEPKRREETGSVVIGS